MPCVDVGVCVCLSLCIHRFEMLIWHICVWAALNMHSTESVEELLQFRALHALALGYSCVEC